MRDAYLGVARKTGIWRVVLVWYSAYGGKRHGALPPQRPLVALELSDRHVKGRRSVLEPHLVGVGHEVVKPLRVARGPTL